jgi:small basic protein
MAGSIFAAIAALLGDIRAIIENYYHSKSAVLIDFDRSRQIAMSTKQ